MRWNRHGHGLIPPDQFIPIAEEVGAIIPICEWALREACRMAANWLVQVSVAANVSTIQFRLSDLPAVVKDTIDASGLDARRLELEMKETAFLRNRATALAALNAIQALGVRMAMNYFGIGYSSLSNLKSFPFDKIKIDTSFVATLLEDEAARSIVCAIVGLGRSFRIPIIAEGVETQAQRDVLAKEGCPQAQGYYFGQPVADPFRIGARPRALQLKVVQG